MKNFITLIKSSLEGKIATWIIRVGFVGLTSLLTYIPTHIVHQASEDTTRETLERVVQLVEADKSNGCH